MKAFFFVVALALIASASAITEEQKEKLRNHSKICMEESGVSVDLIKKVKGGDWTVEDDKLKQWVYCVLKRSALINDEARIQKDVALAKAPEDARSQIEKAIDACIDKTGTDKYDTAWVYMKCYHEERPNHDFF